MSRTVHSRLAVFLCVSAAFGVAGCPQPDPNPAGDLNWAVRAGGSGSDRGYALSLAGQNAFVVAGNHSGNAAFGAGGPHEALLPGYGGRDFFVARYGLDGTAAWAADAGGPLDDNAEDVTGLPDGGAVAAGYFQGALSVNGAKQGVVSAGARDALLIAYSAAGATEWVAHAGGAGGDEARGVDAYENGACVVAGRFEGSATFGLGEANETTLRASDGGDMFLAAYDAGGALQWAVQAGGLGSDYANDVSIAGDGSIVAAGAFEGPITFDAGGANETTLNSAGGTDFFVARFSGAGVLQWAVRAGCSCGDDRANAVAALTDGGAVVAGAHHGTASLGEDVVLTSWGGFDAFIARYDADGQAVWAAGGGSLGDDEAFDVQAWEDGGAVMTGSFTGRARFGGAWDEQVKLESKGREDVFVARYEADGAMDRVWTAGGDMLDQGRGVAALSDGGCLVAGRFRGAFTLGAGTAGETTLESRGACDVFAARYGEWPRLFP
jgi:hypothetical protein